MAERHTNCPCFDRYADWTRRMICATRVAGAERVFERALAQNEDRGTKTLPRAPKSYCGSTICPGTQVVLRFHLGGRPR